MHDADETFEVFFTETNVLQSVVVVWDFVKDFLKSRRAMMPLVPAMLLSKGAKCSLLKRTPGQGKDREIGKLSTFANTVFNPINAVLFFQKLTSITKS